jgi:deoxycytidylate deaminase
MRVGAALFAHDRAIQALGWNGVEPGMLDDEHVYADCKNVRHAEFNACFRVDNAARVRGGTLYVTHFPCFDCARTLALVRLSISCG